MSEAPCDLAALEDPRLAPHATAAAPAWLFSPDGARVLWANAVGAAVFGATPKDMPERRFPSEDAVARQIAGLAATLPPGPPRLYRLRGLGAALGRPLLCGCSRMALGEDSVLVAAMESAGPALSLAERVQRLYEGATGETAAFAADGALLFATASAQERLAGATTLTELAADALAAQALAEGCASGDTARGRATLRRLGSGADTVLVASFVPAEAVAEPGPRLAAAEPAEASESVAAEPELSPLLPLDEVLPARRFPLRFVWQMDAQGRFTLGSEEFTEVIGPSVAVALGRAWQNIAAELALDPAGEVLRAIATRDTWSGITVSWPVDGSEERLAVELSGLPVYDRQRTFLGYRGFGVCRDIARIARLSRLRRPPLFTSLEPRREARTGAPAPADQPPAAPESGRPSLTLVPPSENVVPFRAAAETRPQAKTPALSPVEHSAFRELARQLSARLGGEEGGARDAAPVPEPPLPVPEHPLSPVNEQRRTAWDEGRRQDDGQTAHEEPAPRAEPLALLDRLPVGLLIYRYEELLYANRAFLEATGHASLDALIAAGGLDSLFIDGDADDLAEPGEAGRPLAILTQAGDKMPVAARLFSIPWDGENSLVLMLTGAAAPERADGALRRAEAQIRELRSILDTATDGVIVLDRDGRIVSVNRSAEALFGHEADDLAGRSFADLLAAESRGAALGDLERLSRGGGLVAGREVTALVGQGGRMPLFMTLGPADDGADRFCAVFRDLTPRKKAEEDLAALRREAERATAAKAEFLAKISHEVRTPLNSILGFAEIMLEEKFGPIGNERYRDYLKDIRESGAHMAALINDMLDLSKVEAGQIALSFAPVNLNEVAQGCVRSMQPQANRERIIIRTSLAANLQPIVADARSLQQIIVNLLDNAIKFAGPGGQVIVSTGITDKGGVVLRVRDTGMGMSGKELETALAPFRQLATTAPGADGVGLPLTKALAEANRGTFHIVSKANDGTLVEIAFPPMRIPAE